MRISQAELDAEQRARRFDVDAARVELAALEGVEGKGAAYERKYLQRRVDKADARARQLAELDGMSAAEIAAQVPR